MRQDVFDKMWPGFQDAMLRIQPGMLMQDQDGHTTWRVLACRYSASGLRMLVAVSDLHVVMRWHKYDDGWRVAGRRPDLDWCAACDVGIAITLNPIPVSLMISDEATAALIEMHLDSMVSGLVVSSPGGDWVAMWRGGYYVSNTRIGAVVGALYDLACG